MTKLCLPCAVCGAHLHPLLFHRQRGAKGTAFVSVGRGEVLRLATRLLSDVRVLCDEHFAVLEASDLAKMWFLEVTGRHYLGFTPEQFGRFACARGLTARGLKKRLLRGAVDAARARHRKKGQHDWATVRARQRILDENPLFGALVGNSLLTYALAGMMFSNLISAA